MTLYSFTTLEDAPTPKDTLATLALALAGRSVGAERRVVCSGDSHNPDEGLALIDAHVSIADKAVRQAILDAVIAIAGSNPYRRSRATIAPRADDPEA